jgi:hypothetical protein
MVRQDRVKNSVGSLKYKLIKRGVFVRISSWIKNVLCVKIYFRSTNSTEIEPKKMVIRFTARRAMVLLTED